MKTIGIFDSGIGGLTVLEPLYREKIFKKIIYYADTARVPYGIRSKNSITRYSLEALEFFDNFDVDMVLTACNTVSTYSLLKLQEVSKVEVVGVIEPTLNSLNRLNLPKDSHILVIGTKFTVNSKIYEDSLKNFGFTNITSLETTLFVSIIEEGITSGKIVQELIDYYFKDIKKPDVVILGCTHFPFIQREISAYWSGDIEFVHSGDIISDFLRAEFNVFQKHKDSELEFFASENHERLEEIFYRYLNR
jgi:glutamate racemase